MEKLKHKKHKDKIIPKLISTTQSYKIMFLYLLNF